MPEVIAHPISSGGNPSYLKWISETVGASEEQVCCVDCGILIDDLPSFKPTRKPVLNTAVVSEENGLKLRDSYLSAAPFPLIQMRDMFSNAFLEEVYDTLATKVSEECFLPSLESDLFG